MVPCDPNHRPSFVLCVCLSAWMVVTLSACFPVCISAFLPVWSHLACLPACLPTFLPGYLMVVTLAAWMVLTLAAWVVVTLVACLPALSPACLSAWLGGLTSVSTHGRPRTPQVDFHCRNDMPRSAVCITPGTTTGRGETAERLVYALI